MMIQHSIVLKDLIEIFVKFIFAGYAENRDYEYNTEKKLVMVVDVEGNLKAM